MNENFLGITCFKCGASNMSNSKFCIKCGNALYNETIQSNVETQVNLVNQQLNENPNSTIVNQEGINYFKYILNVILKPYDTFKKEENNLSNFKNSGILVAIVVGIITIFSLMSSILASVRVKSYWTSEVTWVWDNINNVDYLKVIGQNILLYAGAIFAISGIYFLASLVIKKNIKYVKLISVVTTAFIPMAFAITILSPFLSLFSIFIALIISIVGIVYFLVILLELLNDQIIMENKNSRIYLHLVCISVLIIVCGLITYNSLLGSLGSLIS